MTGPSADVAPAPVSRVPLIFGSLAVASLLAWALASGGRGPRPGPAGVDEPPARLLVAVSESGPGLAGTDGAGFGLSEAEVSATFATAREAIDGQIRAGNRFSTAGQWAKWLGVLINAALTVLLGLRERESSRTAASMAAAMAGTDAAEPAGRDSAAPAGDGAKLVRHWSRRVAGLSAAAAVITSLSTPLEEGAARAYARANTLRDAYLDAMVELAANEDPQVTLRTLESLRLLALRTGD